MVFFFFFMQLFKLIGQKHVGAPQGLGPRKTWHCTVAKSKKTRKNSAIDILLSVHFPQAQQVLPANQVHQDHVVLQVWMEIRDNQDLAELQELQVNINFQLFKWMMIIFYTQIVVTSIAL